MKILTTSIARILFAIPFLVFGMMHFAFADQMKMGIPAFVPGALFLVYLSGAGLIAASLSLFIQKWVKEAMIGVSVFLISTIMLVHVPGLGNPDPMFQQMAMSGLFKDIGLLGASLTFLGLYSDKKLS